MKLLILSDLHLEFENLNIDCSAADAVILAGDIHIGLKGIEWIRENFSSVPVFYVLGNHEYYSNKYPKLLRVISEKTKGTNIHLLEDSFFLIDNFCFHGATLWTDFLLFGEARYVGYECQERMTDFKQIRIEPNYSKIRFTDIQLIHKKSLKILADHIEQNKDKQNIVITHHAPSIKSVPQNLQEDIMTAAYASNLEKFIKEHRPGLWIHGHLHTSSDYLLDNCRVICNPRGYPDERNKNFRADDILEI